MDNNNFEMMMADFIKSSKENRKSLDKRMNKKNKIRAKKGINKNE